jgi:hypothetical protein
MFGLDAITRTAERGADITPLIPTLVKFSRKERYSSYHAIMAHLKQSGGNFSSKLAAVVAQILTDNGALDFLPFVVQEGVIDHLDMSSAMPALATLLKQKSKYLVERTVSAMTWAVEGTTDFSSIVDVLEQAIEKPGKEQESLAYCLAYSFARQKQFDRIEHLAKSASPNVRKGATHAIIVQLNNKGKNETKILALAIEGLFDAETDVRERTLNGLIQADRKKISIIPDLTWLKGLVSRLKATGNNKQLFDFVYMVAAKDGGLARSIIDAIKGIPFEPGTTGQRLLATLTSQIDGKHSPVCTICSQIQRDSSYSREPYMSNDTSKLGLEEPSLGSHAAMHECPECGALYWYEYEQEIDDMSLDTSTSLRRLDPVEALERLSGAARDAYQKKVLDLLTKYRADLEHPIDFARGEAAWMLARYAMKKGDWPGLLDLLRRKDEAILAVVLHEITKWEKGGLPIDEIYSLLDQPLSHGSTWIKFDAATIVTRVLIAKKDLAGITRFLESKDPIILTGVTGAIWLAVRNEHLDIGPLIHTLVPLTRADDRSVRNNTLYALQEAGLKPEKFKKLVKGAQDARSLVDLLIKNLADKRTDVRNDAVRSLEYMVDKGDMIQGAIPAIVTLLGDAETTYNAVSTLKHATNRKVDISTAIPALVDCLKDPTNQYHASITELLAQAQKAGVDISPAYDVLGRLMPNDKGNLKPMATQIFEQALKNNEDLSIIEPNLEKAIGRGENDSYSDSFIKIYTYINIKKGEWGKVIKLLEHHNKNVPGPVAAYLAEINSDIEPLVQPLINNLLHRYWYVRGESASALKKYIRYGGHARDVVIAGLDSIDRTGAKDTKDLDTVLAAARAEPKTTGKAAPPTATPEQDALGQMLAKKSYLTNLERVSSYRGQDESRYIFCEGSLLFDTWFHRVKNEITEISWTGKDELPEIIQLGFLPGTIVKYLKPFSEIPKAVITESAALAERTTTVLHLLSDASKWYFLKPDYKTQTKRYVHHHEKRGYQIISAKDQGKLSGLHPSSKREVEREVGETQRHFPGLETEAARQPLLAEASNAWDAAESALKRLEGGEICAEINEDYYRRYFIHNNGKYFYIFADGGKLDTVNQRSRDLVMEAFLEKICGPDAGVTFVTLDDRLKDDILIQTDPTRYLEYLKNGDFSVGGGPTTDMQWTLRYENGVFVRTQADGYGGVNTTTLTEAQVKELLKKKQYGWARSSPLKKNSP